MGLLPDAGFAVSEVQPANATSPTEMTSAIDLVFMLIFLNGIELLRSTTNDPRRQEEFAGGALTI